MRLHPQASFALRDDMFVRFDRTPVCDRQTDTQRQTDHGDSSIYCAGIASFAKTIIELRSLHEHSLIDMCELYSNYGWNNEIAA